MEDEVEKTLINIFKLSGIYITDENKQIKLNIDSMQLVVLIAEIQKEFLLDLFEQNLDFRELHSFNDFLCLIQDMLK